MEKIRKCIIVFFKVIAVFAALAILWFISFIDSERESKDKAVAAAEAYIAATYDFSVVYQWSSKLVYQALYGIYFTDIDNGIDFTVNVKGDFSVEEFEIRDDIVISPDNYIPNYIEAKLENYFTGIFHSPDIDRVEVNFYDSDTNRNFFWKADLVPEEMTVGSFLSKSCFQIRFWFSETCDASEYSSVVSDVILKMREFGINPDSSVGFFIGENGWLFSDWYVISASEIENRIVNDKDVFRPFSFDDYSFLELLARGWMRFDY